MTADTRHCAWCGTVVDAEEGFRAYEPAGGRLAVFCRLEHIVPWAIRGAYWEAAGEDEVADPDLTRCAWCGEPLDEAHVALVRSRGEHLVPDGFCSVSHLEEWAKAGGRWRA